MYSQTNLVALCCSYSLNLTQRFCAVSTYHNSCRSMDNESMCNVQSSNITLHSAAPSARPNGVLTAKRMESETTWYSYVHTKWCIFGMKYYLEICRTWFKRTPENGDTDAWGNFRKSIINTTAHQIEYFHLYLVNYSIDANYFLIMLTGNDLHDLPGIVSSREKLYLLKSYLLIVTVPFYVPIS